MITEETPVQQSDELQRLCLRIQETYQPILVSNRGPVELWVGDNGRLAGRRGSGGVVTALSALSHYLQLTWVAAAMSDGERDVVERFGAGVQWKRGGQQLNLRLVTAPRAVYRRYYTVFANPFLWFLQHYLLNVADDEAFPVEANKAWSRGYLPMNRAFADALVQAAREDDRTPLVLIQDYHLYLVGGLVRERCPEAALMHFVHIPWPAPRYWTFLPEQMRQAICRSLAANDIVGFQTEHDAHNFLRTCEVFLPQCRVDYEDRSVRQGEHRALVRVYPISVDVATLQEAVSSKRVRSHTAKLRREAGEMTIVRVDRVEPSKNIVRGFQAYELLLERHPELRGRVRFLAFLVPSRTKLAEYKRYWQDVQAIITRVNETYGSSSWKPIEFYYEHNYPQAIAGMRLYDVLLVNAVMDGMNLVAKEGPTVNERDGVLVLSEGVGAHAELKGHALTVASLDVEGTANTLYDALTMAKEDRERRADGLRRVVAANDLTHWLRRQLLDVMVLESSRRSSIALS